MKGQSRLPPKLPWKKLSISFFLFDGATPIQPKNGFNGTLKACKCSCELSLIIEAKPVSVSSFQLILFAFINCCAMDFSTLLEEKLSVVNAVERFKESFVIV